MLRVTKRPQSVDCVKMCIVIVYMYSVRDRVVFHRNRIQSATMNEIDVSIVSSLLFFSHRVSNDSQENVPLI